MEGKSFKLLNLTIHPDNNAMFVEQVPFIRGLGSWQTGIGEGRREERRVDVIRMIIIKTSNGWQDLFCSASEHMEGERGQMFC